MTNIYFLTDGYNVKIGKSKNPKKRKSQLQTANTNKLKILYILENVEDYMEKEIHHTCKYYKIQGEWFDKDVINFLMNFEYYKNNLKTLI